MKDWKLAVVVSAMTLLGVAVGAQMFGAQPATAQDTGWRECFFGHQQSVDINNEGVVATPDRAHTIVVPAGYSVVGAGGGSIGMVLFCRR
jgi:hypothetical protein